MKTKNNFALFGILAVIGAWTLLFLNLNPPKKMVSPLIIGEAFINGDKDDANAAFNYEFNRLKDPATGKIPANIRQRELEFATTMPKDADFKNNERMKVLPLNWAARGPYNIGGRTRALAVDITNDSIILAGSVSGSMWRSTDQGNSWTQVSTPAQIHAISCIVQDIRPGHTNIWYYGTGEGVGPSAYANGAYPLGNGIFKSTDNGLTWNSLTNTAANTPQTFSTDFDLCWNMAVDPTAPDSISPLYVATYGKIYRTMDGGINWTIPVNGSLVAPTYTDIAIASNGAKYATMSSDGASNIRGIRRSVDGVTWTKITPDSFPSVYERICIGIDPNNERNVYFIAYTPGAGFPSTMTINYHADTEYYSLWKYTYISGNGDSAGGMWTNLSANIPYNGMQFGNYFSQGGYDMYVKVQPGDSNTVYLGGTDIFRSADAFTTPNNWTQIGGYGVGTTAPNFVLYPNHHPDQHQLRFLHNNPHAMISSCDGGVFKTMDNSTPDSVTWISCNNGYKTTQFYTCALDHATPNNDIITGGLQDNGSFFTNSSNLTAPWTWSCKGDGGYSYVFDNHPFYYFSIQQGKVYKSQLDANGNPTAFRRVDPIGGGGYEFIAPFAVDPNNNNILYLADSSHIWRNTDLSAITLSNQYDSISTNWSSIDSITAGAGQITAVAVSNIPANRMYFGTYYNLLYRVNNANVGNPTRTNITSGLFTGGASVSCIAIDPTNADRVIVTFSNYNARSIFFTSNGGTSWTDISANLEQHPFGGPAGNGPSVRWAKIVPLNGDTAYFVGTSIGLFATSHLHGDSTQWVQQGSATIGNAIVDMIDARISDGKIIVGTHGNGMFSTTLTNIAQLGVGMEELKFQASPLQLRNFPNPADQFTTISFNLPMNEAVDLRLFDLHGKEVATVLNGTKNAGLNSIKFNTNALANGIYFCHLIAGDLMETKKIVVAKE